MKKAFIFGACALLSVSFWSCSSDDDDNNLSDKSVPEAVVSSLNTKYPDARGIEWKKKGDYLIADFDVNRKDVSAWFTSNGTWHMTETDVRFEELPVVVKDAFTASMYSDWKVDDVDKIERVDHEVVYIIEAEQGNQEVDLYIDASGVVVKAILDSDNDDYDDFLPTPVANEINELIQNKYPNARIVDVDKERNSIEVDIIHEGKAKEVVFSLDKVWLKTSWELKRSEFPQVVTHLVETDANYAGYLIDDIDFVETPTGKYYSVELEKRGARDIEIKVDMDGNLLK